MIPSKQQQNPMYTVRSGRPSTNFSSTQTQHKRARAQKRPTWSTEIYYFPAIAENLPNNPSFRERLNTIVEISLTRDRFHLVGAMTYLQIK